MVEQSIFFQLSCTYCVSGYAAGLENEEWVSRTCETSIGTTVRGVAKVFNSLIK